MPMGIEIGGVKKIAALLQEAVDDSDAFIRV
jgi:hypothetical protein